MDGRIYEFHHKYPASSTVDTNEWIENIIKTDWYMSDEFFEDVEALAQACQRTIPDFIDPYRKFIKIILSRRDLSVVDSIIENFQKLHYIKYMDGLFYCDNTIYRDEFGIYINVKNVTKALSVQIKKTKLTEDGVDNYIESGLKGPTVPFNILFDMEFLIGLRDSEYNRRVPAVIMLYFMNYLTLCITILMEIKEYFTDKGMVMDFPKLRKQEKYLKRIQSQYQEKFPVKMGFNKVEDEDKEE